MKLLVVSASQRSPSQSARVGDYLVGLTSPFGQHHHLELCRHPLPFWDGDSEQSKGNAWAALSPLLVAADALVLITPEWGGMATPLLKNFLLMCEPEHTAHKPVLLVSVVNGVSGGYPIGELRMNALKNNKLVPVPDHLIIRNVEQVLNPAIGGPRDRRLRERIDYSLHMLAGYTRALKTMREGLRSRPYPDRHRYAYGM
ncbi:NADPH-dependent FMN reductase [Zobellella sp. DQSA1]|uniref:NADPH-dependent FMN reductase n=1 Tax=Zobellella sp. DQSA1 TaxID=3342386 RepID=UPI0035C029FC